MDTPQRRPIFRRPANPHRWLAGAATICFAILVFIDHDAPHFGWLAPLGLALLSGSFCV